MTEGEPIPKSEIQKEWSPDQVFKLIEEGLCPLHTHPAEEIGHFAKGAHAHVPEQHVEWYGVKVGVPKVGAVVHAEKAYPQEKVLPHFVGVYADKIVRGEVSAEELGVEEAKLKIYQEALEEAFRHVYAKEISEQNAYKRWKEGTWSFGGRILEARGEGKDFIDDALWGKMWEKTREEVYQTKEDLSALGRRLREEGERQGERVLFGLELDGELSKTPEGLRANFIPEIRELTQAVETDYLVVSLHPGTRGIPDEVIKDPELLTQAYEQMMRTFSDQAPQEAKERLHILGHPFRRTPGFAEMSRAQKERVVKAAVENDFAIEISINDFYFDIYGGSERFRTLRELSDPQKMREAIPTLDEEFLELLVAHRAKLTFDTDLHVEDYLKSLKGQARSFAEGKKEKWFGEAAKAWEEYPHISELLDRTKGTNYRDLPPAFRFPIYRAIRTLQYALENGVEPEQIVNLKKED